MCQLNLTFCSVLGHVNQVAALVCVLVGHFVWVSVLLCFLKKLLGSLKKGLLKMALGDISIED